METMCIVMRGSEFLSYGGDGSSKGNDQISRFKHVAHQNSNMDVRLLVYSRTISFLNVELLHVSDHSQTMDSARSAVTVPSRDFHVVPPPIVSGGVLVSPEGPILLCALIGLPAAAVE